MKSCDFPAHESRQGISERRKNGQQKIPKIHVVYVRGSREQREREEVV